MLNVSVCLLSFSQTTCFIASDIERVVIDLTESDDESTSKSLVYKG